MSCCSKNYREAFMKKLVYAFLLMGLIKLTGCATIMSDNKSAVQINTNPTETICEVKGENFTQTLNIPANVTIPAKASPVTITCTKEDYFPASETIETSINGMIFGNIIFGGIPGIIIDLATKSGFDYQDNVALHLYKRRFTSLEEKDAYYAELEERLKADVDGRKRDLNERKNLDDSEYKRELKKINSYYEKELVFLHECRDNSEIISEKKTAEK